MSRGSFKVRLWHSFRLSLFWYELKPRVLPELGIRCEQTPWIINDDRQRAVLRSLNPATLKASRVRFSRWSWGHCPNWIISVLTLWGNESQHAFSSTVSSQTKRVQRFRHIMSWRGKSWWLNYRGKGFVLLWNVSNQCLDPSQCVCLKGFGWS